MKKNLFWSLLTFMTVATVSAGFVSCGGDDDEGGSASSTPTPTLVDINGNTVQISSVGDFWYTYDEQGRLASLGNGDDSFNVAGSTFTIKSKDSDYTASFSLNGNGLITKIHIVGNDTDSDGSYEKDDITLNYSYNSNRQLSSCSASGNGSYYYKEDNERGSYTGSASVAYTWSNNNLTKALIKSKQSGKENNESYTVSETGTYLYTYGSQTNALKQFPYFLGDRITGGDITGLFCVIGLFGTGPAVLPTGYTEQWEYVDDEDEEEESYNYTLSFTLNDNGSIRSERLGDYNTITYQYNQVTRAAEAIAAQGDAFVPQLKQLISNFRKHKK